jgi:flagellar basal-body rod protein FlgF
MRELQVIANNIANASTSGFKAEGVAFSEHISRLGPDDPSLSMALARVRNTDFAQGSIAKTGGSFDLAIEGEGFFLVQSPGGERLTRAGSFTPNANGDLVTMDGYPVLDAGGAPVFVPQGLGPIGIAADGTISAQGRPIGQIGIVIPTDPNRLTREGSQLFAAPGGFEPAQNASVLQGFIEKEDERIRGMIRAMGK